MNIGLLISELEDKEVKKICIGACKAARDKEVSLVIIPGKYLIPDKSGSDNPYEYQYSALFDYADTSDFDVLIVDIERIASRTTILKKEAFLKKFKKAPVITLSEQEGFPSVIAPQTQKDQFEQLGYEAVCEAVFYGQKHEMPTSTQSPESFHFEEVSDEIAMKVISKISELLFLRKYEKEDAYKIFSSMSLKDGILNSAILIYDKKIRNTIKYPWEKPESISIKTAVIDGKEQKLDDENASLSTDKIISSFTKSGPKTLILGDLYVDEYQLGLMISEFDQRQLVDHFLDNLTNIVTGVSRLSYLEKELERTTEELYEVQEELARDDSVLDHIGDQDYLTGGLNRRGFFAKAYDLLKENFAPGKNAIVAYIHMDSLKRINDMFGHEEGDRAVKRVSKILEEVFGDSIYGRIRGDEFAVIVVTDDEGKAETLRESMSEQNTRLLTEANRYINHLQYSICQFGYEENLSLREMLKETDESLQRIKGNM